MTDGTNSQKYWDKLWSHPRRKNEHWAHISAVNLVKTLGAKTILSVGCGRGTTLIELKNFGCDCLGVDISEKAIERLGHGGVKGLVMDAYEIDQIDRTFDFVMCGHLLEHLLRDKEFLRKCKDRLNVGGTCFVAVPNDMSYPEETGQHVRKYNKRQLRKVMRGVFGNAKSNIVGNHLMVWSKK